MDARTRELITWVFGEPDWAALLEEWQAVVEAQRGTDGR